MKHRLLIAAIVLALVTMTGVFFIRRTTDDPLGAEIVRTDTFASGGRMLMLRVTNTSGHSYFFSAVVETLSSNKWESDPGYVNLTAGYRLIAPHRSELQPAFTTQNFGAMRGSIPYAKAPTARQKQFDSWLGKLGLGPFFKRPPDSVFTTSSTNFPPR